MWKTDKVLEKIMADENLSVYDLKQIYYPLCLDNTEEELRFWAQELQFSAEEMLFNFNPINTLFDGRTPGSIAIEDINECTAKWNFAVEHFKKCMEIKEIILRLNTLE